MTSAHSYNNSVTDILTAPNLSPSLQTCRVECLKWLKLTQFNLFPHSLIRKATLLWGNLQMSSFVRFKIGGVNTIITGPL